MYIDNIGYENREGYILVHADLSDYGINETIRIEFKDREQIKKIFKKTLGKINAMDYLWWTDAHKGTKYHSNFETDYPQLVGTFTDDNKYNQLGSIVGGLYSFINFSIPPRFNISKYMEKNYPEFA